MRINNTRFTTTSRHSFVILVHKDKNFMTRISMYIVSLLLLAVLAISCKDDVEITASIEGNWSGTESAFKINPKGAIPAFNIHRSELPVQLEFNSGGELVLTDNKGTSTTGTYSQSGSNLVINIDYVLELIELSGTYKIEELTETNLRATIEKEGSYKHPDTGQEFEGKVEATLHFGRATSLSGD